MCLSPGGFQLASGVGSTQPDPTARGCRLTSGSDADPWKITDDLPHLLHLFNGNGPRTI